MASRSRRITALSGMAMAAAGATLLVPAGMASAAAPEPVYAAATVDGAPGEWSADAPWGTLVSNDPPHRVIGSLSLRYECSTETLFALVTAAPGETFKTEDPGEAYLRLGPTGKLVSGLSGNDGVPPDFAWVEQSGITAAGFEASASVTPGTYPASLRVHAKLPDDSADGYETIDLDPRYRDLTIECPTVVPTSIDSVPSSVIPSSIDATFPETSMPAPTAAPTDPPAVKGAVASAPPVERVELARTGSSSGPLVALGALLLVLGAALVGRAHQLRPVPVDGRQGRR